MSYATFEQNWWFGFLTTCLAVPGFLMKRSDIFPFFRVGRHPHLFMSMEAANLMQVHFEYLTNICPASDRRSCPLVPSLVSSSFRFAPFRFPFMLPEFLLLPMILLQQISFEFDCELNNFPRISMDIVIETSFWWSQTFVLLRLIDKQ